ncbi:MAG: thiamine-phosphate kinase [Parvibaculaceae bacterium]|nr:thiamine-phosphate kinase [Parvibaculaceae bacterium]
MAEHTPSDGDRPDEFTLIEELFAPLAAGAGGAYGLEDDAATYTPSAGHELVLTMDAIVEGVHFLAGDSADLVARKLLRVNLSDLAAKGARPVGYLLTAAFPRAMDYAGMRAFARGLAEDQRRFGLHLWGGDTVATPGPATYSLTAIGEVPSGRVIRRGGADEGDDIYVTGTIGEGALGLLAAQDLLPGLDADLGAALALRYRLPEPRIAFGLALRGLATAGLDISDGLVADLGHLCRVSGVGARIELEAVPLSPGVRAAIALDPSRFERALTGGDDYELLFTASRADRTRVEAAALNCGLAVTRIGVASGEGPVFVDGSGTEVSFAHAGYTHF